MSRTRILCLGDLHLGLRPSRLPADADRRTTSVAAVWRRAVDAALDHRVRAVLLSGDVVHRANRYFEAFGPLEEGVRRLTEADIDVCAVAGNHDFDVFPRLGRLLASDRFHLLGAGGSWDRLRLDGGDGNPIVHIDGWSFPRRDVSADPLGSYALGRPDDGAPVIGLVHGDLDAAESTNAPLARDRLGAAGPGAWILGHIHKPGVFDLAAGRWALYPGSPQPLDPTETGVHGAWWFDVEEQRIGRPEPLPLATVRWEELEIDLAGAESGEDVRARIVGACRRAAAELDLAGEPEWLLLRAALVGRTGAHGELPDLLDEVTEHSPLTLSAGSVRVRLAETIDRTRPAIDLRERARGDDPVALLAGLLLELEGEPGDGSLGTSTQAVIREVDRRLREVYETSWFLEVGSADEIDGARRREVLSAVAADLLDGLLAQKETGGRGSEQGGAS